MTLYIDSSALVTAVVEGRNRALVLDALLGHADWCASALTLAEAIALVPRITNEPILQRDVEDELRLLWDHVSAVPVDQRCLDRASQISQGQPVRLVDAIHLASALRLPKPVFFLTTDPTQIPIALSLGFKVIAP